ncbi:MAG: hypothetical protein ACPL7O_10920, partial [Armatimonadota bacterium]
WLATSQSPDRSYPHRAIRFFGPMIGFRRKFPLLSLAGQYNVFALLFPCVFMPHPALYKCAVASIAY